MSKFFLSIVLFLQVITPYSVGGGELPNDILMDRWQSYNKALDIERAISEKAKLDEAIVAEKKIALQTTKYKLSYYFKQIDHKLSWRNYTRVISMLESSNRYDVSNRFGYLGKYQISYKYLDGLGFNGTNEEFLKDRLSQELVMANYTYRNVNMIRKYDLYRFIGNKVNGIEVTLFGMMASSHLVGIKNLNDYLNSGGSIVSRDGNDTSIEKYMKAFERS